MEIKKITIKRNLIMFNLNHEQGYDCKEGVLTIEYDNNIKTVLDLASNCDITRCDYLFLKDTKDTTEEIIFNNALQ